MACRLVSARAAALLAPKQLGFWEGHGWHRSCRPRVSTECRQQLPQGHVFVKTQTSRMPSIPCGVTSYSRLSNITCSELLPYTSASYSGDSDLQFGDFSLQSQEGHSRGTRSRTALLLPSRPRSAVIAAVVYCRRILGRHVDGGRGRQGGGRLHSAGVGRSEARPHT